MREAKEVEGLGLSPVLRQVGSRVPPEANQTSLVLVEREAKSFEAPSKLRPEDPGTATVLEAHHEIVGVANDVHRPLASASPLVDLSSITSLRCGVTS